MNKLWAQKLDKVLLDIMNDSGMDHDFVFKEEQEAFDFDNLLYKLLDDKLILKHIGEDATSRVVFISPKGRMFIQNGGYIGLIEEKERKERLRQEELQTQRLLLNKKSEPTSVIHIHSDKTDNRRGVWKYIAGAAGVLGSIDGCFNGFQVLGHLIKQLLSLLQLPSF